MTWTKIDQDWADRLAAKGVSRDGRLIAVEALIWSNRLGLDGAIARGSLARMSDSPDPEAAMAELVDAGEVSVTDDGWQIGDALGDQLTSDDVGKLREQARIRQQRQRLHRSGNHSMCNADYCKAASRDVTAASRHPVPSRAEPTDPKGGREEREAGAADARSPSGARAPRRTEKTNGVVPHDDEPPAGRQVCWFCANPAPPGLELIANGDGHGHPTHPRGELDEGILDEYPAWAPYVTETTHPNGITVSELTCPPKPDTYINCDWCHHAVFRADAVSIGYGPRSPVRDELGINDEAGSVWKCATCDDRDTAEADASWDVFEVVEG